MSKSYWVVILSLLLLWGCSDKGSQSVVTHVDLIKNIPTGDYVPSKEDYWENQNFNHIVDITFAETGVRIGAKPDGVKVEINGAQVIVESTIPGVDYHVSGSSTHGSLRFFSNERFKLTLAGVSLKNECCGVVRNQSSGFMYVVVADGTQNMLEDGDVVVKDGTTRCKAALYSVGKLVVSGGGTLVVTGNGKNAIQSETAVLIRDHTRLTALSAKGNGIRSRERLLIEGGKVVVNCAGDALSSKRGRIEVLGGDITVNTTGAKGNGLDAATDILIKEGNINIGVAGAASKAIKADSSVFILGGLLNLMTRGDGVYNEKSRDVSASSCIKAGEDIFIDRAMIAAASSGNGGKGISSGRFIQINGGDLEVKTTGSFFYNPNNREDKVSPKGIKSDSSMAINGGNIKVLALGECEGSEGIESKCDLNICPPAQVYVCSYDDAINATVININGGKVYAYAMRNDAIDANGKMVVNGGLVIANGSGAPEGGIDVDFDPNLTVTGGTIVSIGGMMGDFPNAPANKRTTQNSVAVSGLQLTKGSILNITTTDGRVLFSYEVPRTLNNAGLLYSSPLLNEGKYIVSQGGNTEHGTPLGNGLTTDGICDTAKVFATFTVNSMITKVDSKGKVTHEKADKDDLKEGEGPGGMPPAGGGPQNQPQGGMPQGGAPQGGMPQGGMPQGGMPQGGPPQGGPPPMGFDLSHMTQAQRDSMFTAMFPGAKKPSKALEDAFAAGKITPDSFFHALYPNGMPQGMPFGPGGGPGGEIEKIDLNNLPGGGW